MDTCTACRRRRSGNSCRGGATSEKECSYHFYFAKPTNDLSSEQANFNGNYPFGKARRGSTCNDQPGRRVPTEQAGAVRHARQRVAMVRRLLGPGPGVPGRQRSALGTSCRAASGFRVRRWTGAASSASALPAFPSVAGPARRSEGLPRGGPACLAPREQPRSIRAARARHERLSQFFPGSAHRRDEHATEGPETLATIGSLPGGREVFGPRRAGCDGCLEISGPSLVWPRAPSGPAWPRGWQRP